MDLIYPDIIEEKTKWFPLSSEDEVTIILYEFRIRESFSIVRKVKKLICDWSDKKYRFLTIYIKMGMNIEEVHTVVSFRQKPWLHNILTTIMKKVKQIINLNKISIKVRLHVFFWKNNGRCWKNAESRVC